MYRYRLYRFEYRSLIAYRWDPWKKLSFHDIQKSEAEGMDGYTRMAGYTKITRCCSQALQEGFDYVWVDTCCIDKTSSSELSEAINSMYQWYQNAQVCYAYLADEPSGEDYRLENSAFSRSRWFTR